ncbi:lipopolysaccharide biosynthesis protein [Curtobacterium sp. MCLR17_032]|uniref:lipopolysaccharide biosynthesis protein n=1 Tax=Curtobacterium sp. MCLR17_032 TaxID=2175650 RepID=UPI0015E8C086|nr:lipopolysaccharide biosynthesis protein [Curtobacterium sp. MCLR17_032]WIE62086.1 lipopolysaccharide biosynthesis protein [Curtobacterium sp. MCLR17_032]
MILIGSRGLAAVLQSVSFMLLSRAVDLRTFGVIGVVTAIAGFALLVSDLGVTATLSRARARQDHALVRGALQLNDVVTVVSAVLFGVAAGFAAAPGVALAILAVSLTVERNVETHLSVFYADGSRFVPAVSILGRRLLMLAVFWGSLQASVDGALAFAIAQLAGATFSQVLQRITLAPLSRTASPLGLGTVFRGSWRFWASSVLNQVRILDSAIVGAFASVASAGLYAAAQKLVNPLLLLPASLSQVILPAVARDRSNVRRITKRVCGLFLGTYVVIVPVTFFARGLLDLLFGSPYGDGASILVWAMLGFPMLALSGPLAAILQGLGDEGFVALNGALFAVVALIAMVGGAIMFGPTGVAAGMTIAYTLRTPVLVVRIFRSDLRRSESVQP